MAGAWSLIANQDKLWSWDAASIQGGLTYATVDTDDVLRSFLHPGIYYA